MVAEVGGHGTSSSHAGGHRRRACEPGDRGVRPDLPQRLGSGPADVRAGRRVAGLARVPDRVPGGAGQDQPGVPGRGPAVRGRQRHPVGDLPQGRPEAGRDAPVPGGGGAGRAVGGGRDRGGAGVPVGLRRHAEGRPGWGPWFRFYRTERLVTCYYFYIHDRRAGPAFIKVCAYAPYPVKVWLNGHEIARRAALAEGIAVTPLASGFAATSDPARLQELCDLVQAGTLRVFFEPWMSRIPLPLTDADRDHGCWWQLSMRQVEVSRTLVFDDPRRVRTVFEQLLAGNMNLGRPEHAEIIFAARVTRKTPGTFSTRLLNRADQVTVNLSFRHSRIKIYLKQDRALRIESVINDPGDLGCKRGLEHLEELAAKARACNARLMDAVIAGQGSGILANPVIERIAHPSSDEAGRRVPSMRFGDPRVQALAGCLAVWDFAVSGITNQDRK